jgi:hypothetical protein
VAVAPVDIFVKVIVEPIHALVGAAMKSAFNPHPIKFTVNVTGAPTHPAEVVSTTLIWPLLELKVTVMLLAVVGEVIIASVGKVQL